MMEKRSDNPCLPLSDTIVPTDAGGVADAVRRATETSTAVYPIGGATNLGLGSPPDRSGIGLSLAKLNRLVDHAARDLTITVEAGMTVARLQKTLAAARQRLPVDVARPEVATIGGAVAVGVAGPRCYRHGTIRDYILGLCAVDGRGTEFEAGGRVVKNAAGYNVCRLLTGSLGTLGVITQVTLMVRPMVESEGWIACGVSDFATCEKLLADLVHSATLPMSVEWLVGPAWTSELSFVDITPGAAGRLLIGFEGAKDEVHWMLDSLAARWKQLGVDSPGVIEGAKAKSTAQNLTNSAAAANDSESSNMTVRVSVLPSVLAHTIEQIAQLVGNASIQAHAGDGVLVARLPVEPQAAAHLITDQLRPLVDQAKGTMVVVDSPRDANLDRAAIWGPEPAGFCTMRAIKRQFDPKNILNPGRFIYK